MPHRIPTQEHERQAEQARDYLARFPEAPGQAWARWLESKRFSPADVAAIGALVWPQTAAVA